jgi:hypothetical protein
MLCEEFLVLLADGKLTAEAEQHARDCAECDDVRAADAALKSAYGDVAPDRSRKEEFIRGLASPRPKILRLAWFGVAAAAVMAVILIGTWQTQEDYASALKREAEARLENLAVEGDVMQDVIAVETAVLEEALVQDLPTADISLQQAARELSSTDLVRRVAARRVLSKAAPQQLESLKTDHPYITALMRSVQETKPQPEGSPIVSVQQQNNNGQFTFQQFKNGVVHVVALSQGTNTDVWAHDVYDLASREPELCKKFGIVGNSGRIQIGASIKSPQSIRVGLSGTRDLRELDEIRWEALATEITRRKGDTGQVSVILSRVAKSVKSAEIDGRLKEIRSRASDRERRAAEEVEKTMEYIRRLERFCEEIKTIRD